METALRNTNSSTHFCIRYRYKPWSRNGRWPSDYIVMVIVYRERSAPAARFYIWTVANVSYTDDEGGYDDGDSGDDYVCRPLHIIKMSVPGSVQRIILSFWSSTHLFLLRPFSKIKYNICSFRGSGGFVVTLVCPHHVGRILIERKWLELQQYTVETGKLQSFLHTVCCTKIW